MNEIAGNFLPFLFSGKVSKPDDMLKNCGNSPILQVTHIKADLIIKSLGINF